MSEFKDRLNKIAVRNMKVKHEPNKSWPMEKKIEVVSQFLVLGNMKMVAAMTGVSYDLIRQWKTQPWWKELETEIRQTQNIELDTKLSKIVDKSLDATLDRIENGEFFYDNKTGKVKRRPAALRDVARVAVDTMSKRELIRGNATERREVSQISVGEQLKLLAAEFAKWQHKSSKEVIDVEVLEVLDVEDKGDQAGQVVEDSVDAVEVWDSDEQGGLGSAAESEQADGAEVDGVPGSDSGVTG
jgi:transposase-like protein